jgi:hypothetical protein
MERAFGLYPCPRSPKTQAVPWVILICSSGPERIHGPGGPPKVLENRLLFSNFSLSGSAALPVLEMFFLQSGGRGVTQPAPRRSASGMEGTNIMMLYLLRCHICSVSLFHILSSRVSLCGGSMCDPPRALREERKLWKLLQNLHAFTGTNFRVRSNKTRARCSYYDSLRWIEPACTLATMTTVAAAALVATHTTCRSKDASRYMDWTEKSFQTTRPGC